MDLDEVIREVEQDDGGAVIFDLATKGVRLSGVAPEAHADTESCLEEAWMVRLFIRERSRII